ncbi:unnamed protein product [Ilex paraguariensis]|uniref:CRIB domain-containing protein n=1 Tax=Ilex paraguariensis TaxID=185542 RepID=A0ABC8R6H1_9AQUA
MSTKMKGLLKGLRYISQIFDDDKEPEMQIGFPTDVKHVAHIGWDGPSVDNSPSWMQEFKSPGGFQSAPLGAPTDSKENPEIKWVSEDSSSRRGTTRTPNSPARDKPELPKSSRRHSSTDNSLATTESPRRESSTKSRQSRRNQSKDTNLPNTQDATGLGPDSPTRSLPDIPKKSRRKKSKESNSGGSSRSSRSKGATSSTYTSPFSDPGPETGMTIRSKNNEIRQSSSLKPLEEQQDKESRGGVS